MSTSASSTHTPEVSSIASSSPAWRTPTSSEQGAEGKELQATALTNHVDIAKVSVVATLPRKRKSNHDAMEADRIIAAEQRRLANSTNKHVAAMRKWSFLKVAKGNAQVQNYATKVTALKTQIKGAAAALDPSLNADRDIGGARNRFDHQRTREFNEENIGAWKGSKWTDEKDPNIVWFQIPVSQKTLAFSGRMVPIQEILDRSIRFPEFRLMGNVMVEHAKTGKEVLGFYKITYEKVSAEQVGERMGVMVEQAKAEAAQWRKDDAAERRRVKGGSRGRRV